MVTNEDCDMVTTTSTTSTISSSRTHDSPQRSSSQRTVDTSSNVRTSAMTNQNVAETTPTGTISNIPSLLCAFSASATTGGTSYAFGIYSSALKHNLHLSQGQLDSISTAFFVAGLFTFIPGYCSDRFGTKMAMSLGGCTGATSLLLYWCVAKQFIYIQSHTILVYILSGLGIATFLSCGLVTGAVFKIIVSSTGLGTKGSAVGVAKGFVGLGAGLYTCLFQSIQATKQSALDFLPMAAFLFLSCATIPAIFLLPSKQLLASVVIQDDCTPLHFRTLYCSLFILAVIIISSTMMKLYETERDGSASSRSYGMTIVLSLIWIGPIASLYILPRGTAAHNNEYDAVATSSASEHNDCEDAYFTDHPSATVVQRQHYHDDPISESDALFVDTANTAPSAQHLKQTKQNFSRTTPPTTTFRDDVEEMATVRTVTEDEIILETDNHRPSNYEEDVVNMNLLQMIQTPTAIAMLWTTVILTGAGTVETNNMGQMVESLQFDPSITAASLAFFSVAQAASRVFTGTISESALTWNTNAFCITKGIPRPFFMVVASIVGCVAHFVLGMAKTEFIFVLGVTLSGVAFGMIWPLMVLISAEVFGVAGAGQNYMFYDGVSSAGGTLIITKFVAQSVYDYNTDPNGADSKTCIGMDCFQSTHMIVAGLCLSCVLSSIIMMFTSRHSYNKPILHTH